MKKETKEIRKEWKKEKGTKERKKDEGKKGRRKERIWKERKKSRISYNRTAYRIGSSYVLWKGNSASAERVPLLFYERTLNWPPSRTSLTVPPYVKLSYLSFTLVCNFSFISETNHAYICVLKRAMKLYKRC